MESSTEGAFLVRSDLRHLLTGSWTHICPSLWHKSRRVVIFEGRALVESRS